MNIVNIVNNWYQEDMQNDHLNVSNWNIKEIGDEWEAINIVSVYDMSVIYLTREISGCELQWERLKLLLCASKQLCGLELIAWRLCIMYQAGSFFLDFFLEIWWEQRKGYCVCGIAIEGKGSSKPTTATATKLKRLLQVSLFVCTQTHQWWSLNWDIVIFTLFACISMDFSIKDRIKVG